MHLGWSDPIVPKVAVGCVYMSILIMRTSVLSKTTLSLLALSFATIARSDVNESDYFKDTIGDVSRSVDLVKDYQATATDREDDSQSLQRAIDEMTKLPQGGKIYLPEGDYYLAGIVMKPNVHIVVDAKATLLPTEPGMMFTFGRVAKANNVSIRGKGGRYTVDLREVPSGNIKMAFANFREVENFMIADFNILDNFTRLSSITLNLGEFDGKYSRPRNGVVKNGHVDKGHFGYGLIQAQVGYKILFKDLSAVGGVTLRMETGAVAKAPVEINLDQIYARNISIKDGHGGTMMGSHVRQNGHADIDGVYAESAIFAASVGIGFANKEEAARGLKAGRFASSSVIKNVHAVYGTKAQLKPKNFHEIPESLKHLISKQVNPDGVSYNGPSAAPARCLDPDIQMTNVSGEGFEHLKDLIVRVRHRPRIEH